MPRGRPAFIPGLIPELMGRQKRRPTVARSPIALAHNFPFPAERGTDIGVPQASRRGEGVLTRLPVILRRDHSLRPGRNHPAGAFDANNGHSVGDAIWELGFPWFEEPITCAPWAPWPRWRGPSTSPSRPASTKQVEMADNPTGAIPSRTPKSRRTAHSAVGAGSRPREARAAPQAALMSAPPVTDLRPIRHGMARRSDVHLGDSPTPNDGHRRRQPFRVFATRQWNWTAPWANR
jgi:hypothetical protein